MDNNTGSLPLANWKCLVHSVSSPLAFLDFKSAMACYPSIALIDSLIKGGSRSGREDCQHAVTDESLCPVNGCALGTDVCHWMFKTQVNMVQGQEDGPLSIL